MSNRLHVIDAALRTDFVCFLRKVFGTVSPGQPFLPNWHIDAIAYQLMRVMHGEVKRLIITVPPRHLKSITSSVAFPAYVLGHDPTCRIVCASYSSDLALKHAHDWRAVVRSDWYRRIFPQMRIDKTRDTQGEVATTQHGYRFTTSVGGTLTGRGGSLILIDDPIKPQDAHSEAARAVPVRWFENTVLSRLDNHNNDAIVVIMQRLHVDDLAGHLLERGGWEHLDLPAIAEAEQTIDLGYGIHPRRVGDVLHPERLSRQTLDDLKRDMGSADFAAQYQQAPVPPGGNMIRWQWFRFYDARPNFNGGDQLIISWDTAKKETDLSDYSVGTVWLVRGHTFYLLDLVRERMEFPTLRRRVLELVKQWPAATVVIEDAGSGTSLIQEVRQQGIWPISFKPTGDKIMRAAGQTAKIEAGAINLPRSAPWLADLKVELLSFPRGKHDDQVDSIVQALAWNDQRLAQHRTVIVGRYGSGRSL